MPVVSYSFFELYCIELSPGGLTDFGDEGMTRLLDECCRSLREDKVGIFKNGVFVLTFITGFDSLWPIFYAPSMDRKYFTSKVFLTTGSDKYFEYFIPRLLLQRDYKLYPEIMNVPVRKPLFIIGNPRTGM